MVNLYGVASFHAATCRYLEGGHLGCIYYVYCRNVGGAEDIFKALKCFHIPHTEFFWLPPS